MTTSNSNHAIPDLGNLTEPTRATGVDPNQTLGPLNVARRSQPRSGSADEPNDPSDRTVTQQPRDQQAASRSQSTIAGGQSRSKPDMTTEQPLLRPTSNLSTAETTAKSTSASTCPAPPSQLPKSDEVSEPHERRASQVGSIVGKFQIEKEIASGGMGTVFLAQQLKPVRREVALKMIRRGLDDDETLRRFHAERQALALMDHPSIAKIYEADTTPFGNPYFAMEYCHGLPINEYCRTHRLSIQARIQLVVQLAKAVASAHRLGVVHRDLKPDNVLVAERDGQAELKIIDFGIAKFSDQGWEPGDDNATRTGEFVGTPAYMSPEQALGGLIDARADVFAVGAILFELLTDTTPLLPPEHGCDTIASIIAYVQSFEPVTPSRRLRDQAADRLQEFAATCQLTGNSLIPAITGDLDWVCLQAIQQDKLQRYATCDDLAEDLQRYLNHQPVSVAAPSLAYRTKKYYLRHRGFVHAVLAVACVLFLFAGIFSVQSWNRATTHANRARALTQQLSDALASADVAHRNIDQGGDSLEREFAVAESNLILAQAALDEFASLPNSFHPYEIPAWQQDIKRRQQQIQFERKTISALEELSQAREQAARFASQDSNQDRSQQDLVRENFRRIDNAFSQIGVELAKTAIEDMEKLIQTTPTFAQVKLIESLDFIVGTHAFGAGIFLNEGSGRFTIAELVPGGAAEATQQLRQGDRILKINNLDLVAAFKQSISPRQLQVLAYQELFARPGKPIRLSVVRSNFEPFDVQLTATGEVNHWAVAILKRIDPDSWRTALRKAILSGDLVALKRLGTSPEIDAQPPFSLIQLATAQFSLERSNEAIEFLRICQRRHRNNFWANLYLGSALLSAEQPARPEQAIRYLTAAVALRPSSLGARLDLATAYFAIGNLPAQLSELEDAARISPDHPGLQNQIDRLSFAIHGSERSNELLAIDREATSVTLPADTHLPVDRQIGQPPETQAHPAPRSEMSKRQALTKPSVPARHQVANPEQIRLQRIASHYPAGSLDRLEAKARAFALDGNRDAAMQMLAEIEKRFPRDARLKRVHGVLLLDLNDATAARIVLAGAAQISQDDAATRFYYGVALQHCGKLDEALHEYRAAVKLRPDYAAAQLATATLEGLVEED